MRAAGLICLGAGAGLIRGDLREVRGTGIACRSGGVLVEVRGARPRPVPVLSPYHSRLLAAARFAGTGLICGGTDPGRRNLTNPLVSALDGGGGLRLGAQIIKNEQPWLPGLAPRLPLPIPYPERTGVPGCGYPYSWSVVPYLPGMPAAQASSLDRPEPGSACPGPTDAPSSYGSTTSTRSSRSTRATPWHPTGAAAGWAQTRFIQASWFARPRSLGRASSAGPPLCSRSPAWRRLLPGRAERAGRAR
jgi:hypothetical protein